MAEIQAEDPYTPKRRPWPRRTLGHVGGAILRPLMRKMLGYDSMREYMLHYLSNELAMKRASFRKDVPEDLKEIKGFEDCAWLFSPNKLNHGIIRMRIDQGAFLYRTVHAMQSPRAIELGRYRGGGAFLLAAAGAHVISLDNGEVPGQEAFAEELEEALEHFGLRDRVEILWEDALEYPVEPESFDWVGLDFPKSYDLVKRGFERWWPAVKPGGYLLVNNGKRSPLVGVVQFTTELDIAALGGTRVPNAPGSFVLFQKQR